MNTEIADILDEVIPDLDGTMLEEVELDADGVDPRIKLLSYSSLQTLHLCPRKYELYRKKATDDVANPEAVSNQNVTFAFGHVVGEAIQDVMGGMKYTQVIWRMFLGWHASLADEDTKRAKSFYLAVLAIQNFIAIRKAGFLDDYELLEYNGKLAKELSFRITLPDGYLFRGSVDAVLRHKKTGKILVLECKTSSMVNLNPTQFKNSSQAIGYSVVLDVIAPDISSYDVLYLVYLTKGMNYEQLRFPKTYLQRATWIQELLLDIETIKLYERTGVYPMRGENCTSWGRDCEYLNQCTLSTRLITNPPVAGAIHDDKIYDIEFTLADLIEGQMRKVIPITQIVQEEDQPHAYDGDTLL